MHESTSEEASLFIVQNMRFRYSPTVFGRQSLIVVCTVEDASYSHLQQYSSKPTGFECDLYTQCAPFERNPTTITYYGTEINQKQVHPRVVDSPNDTRNTRVKVTLVARPLLTLAARKLCMCEHGVFTSRTCVHSRTLLRTEIVCCCS
jgi:hypothetical protein